MKKTKQPTDKYKKIKIILLIILTSILLFLILKDKVILFLLYPIGILLGYYSTIISKFVPHITLETMSIMTIVVGFSYGMQTSFFYGFIVSLVVYSLLGLIKITTLMNSIVIGLGGIAASLVNGLGSFGIEHLFMLAIIIRAIMGILIFWNITSDKIEAAAHAIIDPMFNIAIYMPVFFQVLKFIISLKS